MSWSSGARPTAIGASWVAIIRRRCRSTHGGEKPCACSKRSGRSNRSSPLLHPPPRRGGGKRWGIEQSAAVERLERFEPLTRDMSDNDVIIIGSGMAGLTAGLFAARHGLSTLVLENNIPGGHLISIEKIED